MGLTAGSAADGPLAQTTTVDGEQFDVDAVVVGSFRGIWMNEPSLSMACDRNLDSDFKGGARRHGDTILVSLMQRFRVHSGLPIQEQDDQVRNVALTLYEPRGLAQGRDPFTRTLYEDPNKQAEIEEHKARTLHDDIERSIGTEMRAGYWFGRSPLKETRNVTDGTVTAYTLESAGRDCSPGNLDDNKTQTGLLADFKARGIRGKRYCGLLDNFSLASVTRDQMYAPIENPLADQGYLEGQITGERKAGWKLDETVHAGSFTFGKQTGAHQVRVIPAEGATELEATIPSGDTIVENTRFGIAGVNAINLVNGMEVASPMSFRCTETVTGNASNRGVLKFDPPMNTATGGGNALRTSWCSKLPTLNAAIRPFGAPASALARTAMNEKTVPLSFWVQQDSTLLAFSTPEMTGYGDSVGFRHATSEKGKYSITFAKQFDIGTFRMRWRMLARWGAKTHLPEAGYVLTGRVAA